MVIDIRRRDVIGGAGALALAGIAPPAAATVPDDGYFLSKTNPVANVDQRDLEALAIRLFARADVQAACTRAATSWEMVTSEIFSTEQWARFKAAMSDYCFKSVLVATNVDAEHPRVLRVYSPAARWLGHDVPASKWGGDNPDNAYRIIPVAIGGRYEVRGQRQQAPSTYVSYQLVANSSTSVTLGSLEQRAMVIASDGSFVLTIDETPANGRPNHLQLKPGALYLFIRDSLADWSTEAPDALRVRRLNPPSRPPMSDDELAARAIQNIVSDVYYAYYAERLFLNAPPQAMTAPRFAGSAGGLVTQVGSLGNFSLAEDDAIVITTNAAGASYRNIVLHDMWLRSLDYRDHQNSLNSGQMAADADGRFTCVIALRDPGVHNWLDASGLHELLVLHRWQGLPSVPGDRPTIETRKVKLSALGSALPRGVRMVTPAERARQLAVRRAGYDRRFIDS